MGFWTYMLECFKDGESKGYYTGQTNNLRKRTAQHKKNAKRKKKKTYTGRFDAVKLVWAKKKKTRKSAERTEAFVKKFSRKKKRRLAKSYSKRRAR